MFCVRSFVEAICKTYNSTTSEHNNTSVSGKRVSGDGGGGGGGIDPSSALWPVVLLEDSISQAFTSAFRHLTISWQRSQSEHLSSAVTATPSSHLFLSHHHCHSEEASCLEAPKNVKNSPSRSQSSLSNVMTGAASLPQTAGNLMSSKSKLTEYSLEQVADHSTPRDCWIVIYDKIYDITHFLQEHPGGEFILLEFAGRDATLAFRGTRHGPDSYELLKKYLIGILPQSQRIYEKKKSTCNLLMSSLDLEPNPSC